MAPKLEDALSAIGGLADRVLELEAYVKQNDARIAALEGRQQTVATDVRRDRFLDSLKRRR